jgi:hypothetical protein
MGNSYNCKLYSHTPYAMQTDHNHNHLHHHFTYESPKQYYSTQLSHTFSNNKIVLTSTKITTATSYKKKKNHMTRMWLARHKAKTFPAIYFIQNAPTEPSRLQVTPSWPLVAPLFLFPGDHLSFTGLLGYVPNFFLTDPTFVELALPITVAAQIGRGSVRILCVWRIVWLHNPSFKQHDWLIHVQL